MKLKKTTKQFTNSKGDKWEWEENEETRKAIQQLEQHAPDYGVGK